MARRKRILIKDRDDLIRHIREAVRVNCMSDLNHLDVSQVTDMHQVFQGSSFNGDISQWDVSNVTNMERMFEQSRFKGDISQWSTSKVTTMRGMFSNSVFNEPIGDWDTSNVQDMSFMFYSSYFNQPLAKWNTSKVTDMNHMFASNKRFDQSIRAWDVSNVLDMESMFMGSDFNRPLDRWNTKNLKNIIKMFLNSKFTGDISRWNLLNVTHASCAFHSHHFQSDLPEFSPNINMQSHSALQTTLLHPNYKGSIHRTRFTGQHIKEVFGSLKALDHYLFIRSDTITTLHVARALRKKQRMKGFSEEQYAILREIQSLTDSLNLSYDTMALTIFDRLQQKGPILEVDAEMNDFSLAI